MHARLAARATCGGILGVNIGAKRTQKIRVADYVAGIGRSRYVEMTLRSTVVAEHAGSARSAERCAPASMRSSARVREARDARRRGAAGARQDPTRSRARRPRRHRHGRARRAIDGMIVFNTTASWPPGAARARIRRARPAGSRGARRFPSRRGCWRLPTYRRAPSL